MNAIMRCNDEGYRVFKSKGVEHREYQAQLIDVSEGVRTDNNFGLVLEGEVKDKFQGKVRDQVLDVAIRKMQQRFDGTIRIEGSFTVVNGASAKK